MRGYLASNLHKLVSTLSYIDRCQVVGLIYANFMLISALLYCIVYIYYFLESVGPCVVELQINSFVHANAKIKNILLLPSITINVQIRYPCCKAMLPG
jgi:hypothetical protein